MKSIFGLIALIALLIACGRATDVSPTSPTFAAPVDIPTAVAGSISRVFPNAKVVTYSSLETGQVWAATLQADARYAITLNSKGDFYTIFRQIDAQALPEISRKDIPSGLTVQKVYQDLSEQKVTRGYVVVVADAQGATSTYRFSSTGQLQTAANASSTTQLRDSVFAAPLFSMALAASELPEAIKTYQRTNLPDYTVSQAFVLTVGGSKSYYIILRKGDSYLPLYFDEQGKKLSYGPYVGKGLGPDEVALASNDIPQSARTVLDLYYPGWQFITATTNTGRTAYSLAIRQGYYTLLLFYDKTWTLQATYRQQ